MTELTREDFKKALVHHIKGNSRAPFYKEIREALRIMAGIPGPGEQRPAPAACGPGLSAFVLFIVLEHICAQLELDVGDRLEIAPPTLSDLKLPAFLHGNYPEDDKKPQSPFTADPHNHRGKGKRKS